MKRFLLTVGIAISILFFQHPRVIATTPTPTPKPTSLPIPSGKPVDAGVLNTMISNMYSTTNTASEAKNIPITIPSVDLEAGADFKVASLDAVATVMEWAAPYLTAYEIKQKIIPQEKNLYISGRATYCKYGPNGAFNKEVSEKAYITEILPELSTIDQASRQIGALLTRYSFSPDENGNYDFRHDPLELANAPECDMSDTGDMQQDKQVELVQGSTILGWLTNIWDMLKRLAQPGEDVQVTKTFSSKQLTPYSDSVDCLVDGCAGGNDLSYLPTQEEQKRVGESGGIANTYASIYHDVTKGEKHGEQDNFAGAAGSSSIKTHTGFSKSIENATNYILCSVLPKSQRDKYGMAGKCQNETTLPIECESGVPDLPTSGSCKLKNNTLGLPKTLVTVIESAAKAYNVPPGLLVAVLYGEGAFENNRPSGPILKDEALVQKYLDGCMVLPQCDPNANIINSVVQLFQINWPDIADAVKAVDPDRQPNPCNLLDVLFALAKDLSVNQYGAAVFAGKTCFGIPLKSGTGAPTSCTWTDSAAETAIRVWEFGNGWDDATKSCATKLNSCFTGGGMAMQCPTGGDTCETINKRYSQKSHNACIWDVYKSN